VKRNRERELQPVHVQLLTHNFLVEPRCHIQRKGLRPSRKTLVQQDGATILPLS
jgi:hypothetical protein